MASGILELINERKNTLKFSDYLDLNCVCFLDSNKRDDALKTLVDSLVAAGKLKDGNSFYDALLKREKILSTGIGRGVAIPHAKGKEYGEFFMALGICQKGVDWNSLDKSPVRLIFLIGGPEDRQNEYLQILSKVTFAMKEEQLRKKLLTSSLTKEDVTELLSPF